ncbi:MAG: rod shape-determining protein MreD [Dysgonamonadaceae bacterium]|jgi:rod shape-determining protein MreD|nr:rod shape-determining protein MreD [Dysgonamonadaceae bacterium]
MSTPWIRQTVLFILLVFLQVWLFNKIHIGGFATPLVYIYFIIKLPVEMNRNMVLLIAALIGLTIDLFTFTLGLNMLATVIAGFSRTYLLKLFAPKNVYESFSPSLATFGKALFLRYAFLIILLHQIVLFVTESFSFFEPLQLVLRITGSYLLTLFLVYAFEKIQLGKIKS